MSKKIIEIYEDLIPKISHRILQLEMQTVPKEAIDNLLQDDIKSVVTKLKSCNIHELNSSSDKYRKQENMLLTKFFKMQSEGSSISDTDLALRSNLELMLRCIEQAITEKREYNRQFSKSDIFEKTLIKSGAILAGAPKSSTLEKYKKANMNKELILQIERNTMRANLFTNSLGKTLQSYDLKVLVGLFKIWLRSEKQREIRFQFTELAEAMNSRPSGGEYTLIYDSLTSILNTTLVLKAYMDEKSGIYSAQAEFHPIDNITWIARTQNEDKPGKQREAIVTFGDMIYKNLINGNYIFLSSVIYNELPTPYARLIYLNLLDRLSEDTTFRTFDMDELIHQLVILADDDDTDVLTNRSRITRQIEDAFDRLKEQDIIIDYKVRKQSNRKKWIDITPSKWIISDNIKKLS